MNELPDSDLLVIQTKDDARKLLDNTTVMSETPYLPEVSADNYYLISDSLPQMSPVELNAYLWEPDIFVNQKTPALDWLKPYRQVYYANSVLAKLPVITGATPAELNVLKGTALFLRGYAFYNIALEFANLYNSADPNTTYGIPIRLSPDPESASTRGTLKQTYDQILEDVTRSVALLPQNVDASRKNRPFKAAAYALLARIYLSMTDYANAKAYADSCLISYTKLLDYNSFIGSSSNPFNANNEEVLYQSNLNSETGLFFSDHFYIDSNLYRSYADNDLRKELFFSIGSSGLPVPRFSYTGANTKFSGIAVDEVLLVRAECNARMGFTDKALRDIDSLLTMRWKDHNYHLPQLSSSDDALQLVLQERRKELVFRGLRWSDVRRLNDIGASITLKRLFKQSEVTLPPGDNRYVLPIPPDVISYNPGMLQNPR